MRRLKPGLSEETQSARRSTFERLARQHYREIYRAAYRLTGNREEAADLTQEAFVKAYVSFHQFQPGTNFRAWMLRILSNTHISRYRYNSRRPQSLPWDAVTDAVGRETRLAAETTAGPEELVLARFTSEEIDVALMQLPEEFRTVAVMADIYGMAYKDIANALNIPIGTVRSRLFRARRLLRRHLAEYAKTRGLLGGSRDEGM